MVSKRRAGIVAAANASFAVVERLEGRQLLSAAPGSSSQLSDVAANNAEASEITRAIEPSMSVSAAFVAFNSAIAGTTNAGPSHIETVTITNQGTGTLIFDSGAFTIIGNPNKPNSTPSAFSIVNSASLPTNLAPGASTVVQLRYTATIVGTQAAILEINSNDPTAPSYNVGLNGVGTSGQYGYAEPTLVQVLRANGIPTIVGDGLNDVNSASKTYPESPDPSSQEVPMQRMVAAGPGPVTITALAAFDTNTAPAVKLGYYTGGNANDLTELFNISSADAQTMNPAQQGASSFSPGSTPFSLYGQFPGTTIPSGGLDTHYSEDALNTLDPTHSRKFRFFPLENAAGGVIPNSFVFAVEDYNSSTYNSFVNFVGVISNVTAAPSAAHGSTPSSTTGSNPGVANIFENGTAPASDTLVFNTIRTPNSITADIVHDTNTVTIFNTGDSPLTITSLALSDTKNWQIVNAPAAGTTIAGNSSLTLTIKFIATSVPPHTTNQTNDVASGTLVPVTQAGGVWTGTLTITTSDTVNPSRIINLSGWWQIQSEHENEPNFSTLDNLLFQYQTSAPGSSSTNGTEYPSNGNTPVTYGSEVDPSTNQGLLVASTPGGQVGLFELAAFHQQFLTVTAMVGAVGAGIASASESGTTATITTAAAAGFKVGDQVTIAGVAIAAYNGTFTIAATPTSTTFTYALSTSGLATSVTTPTSPQSGYYLAGGHAKFLFRDVANNGQSVLPNLTNDSLSTATTYFTPTTAFGLDLDGEKSEDSQNLAADTPFNTSGHAIRFYPLIDANGNAIPNTWLVGMDYRNYENPNGDYQDLFMVLTGATFESIPASPIDIQANIGTSGVNLQWAASTNDASYNVYRSVDGGAMTQINTSAVTTTSFTDTSAPGTGNVTYQVTGVNTKSVESSAVAASINLTSSAPATPTIQSVDGSTGTAASITWTGVSGATGYTLYREDPNTTVFTQIASGIAATSYSDTAVIAGSTYKYEVQTQNSSGSSGLSPPATVTISIPPSAPTAPVIQQADGSSGTQVVLTWTEIANADTYVVEREGPGETTFTQVATGLTLGTYTDTAVSPGASYQYEVVAQNSLGDSPASAPATAMVPSRIPTLLAPTNVQADASVAGQVVLTWDASAGATTYLVERESPGSSTFVQVATGLTSTTFTDTNVLAGATYQYVVQAQAGSAFSNNTPAVSATLPAPAAATDVTIGKGANKLVQFADADGTVTVIKMTGLGTATVHFTGSTISQNTVKGAVVLSGDGVAVSGISITRTNAASGLTITTKGGNGNVAIGGISADASLGSIVAKTTILNGSLSAVGSVGKIVLGSANSASISVGGALQTLQIGTVTGASVTAAGVIRNIKSAAWNSADAITAPSITAINITGNATLNINTGILHTLHVKAALTDSTITLTAPGAIDLATLSAGSITDSIVNASGNIGTVSAAALTNSKIYAGVVSTATLPSAVTDFSSTAFINAVNLKKNAGGSDTNSSIAASIIKRASLGTVVYSNGGTPFGVAATSIKTLVIDNPVTGKSVSLANLVSQDIVTADLASKGITPQDFVIQIV